MISHLLKIADIKLYLICRSFVDLKTSSNIVLLKMALVKRLSLITKCLAVVVIMAGFPYDTKGSPNNNKNSSTAVFQEVNIDRLVQAGSPCPNCPNPPLST